MIASSIIAVTVLPHLSVCYIFSHTCCSRLALSWIRVHL